jgi:hypothetical protein
MRAKTLLQISFQLKVFTQSYGPPKVTGVPILGISGLPVRSPGTKCHLDAVPVARNRIYYKGEGGGFPQLWVVVNLVSSNLPVVNLNTKSAQIMH